MNSNNVSHSHSLLFRFLYSTIQPLKGCVCASKCCTTTSKQSHLQQRYTLTAHLVAGAFEDKVALLDEVKGELEVQIGALAQGLEVGAELAEGGVVHLAVERDVVLDLGAAVDAVQDVALQVLVDGVVLLQGVQRDAVERQLVGDLLRRNTWVRILAEKQLWAAGFSDAAALGSTCKVVLTVTTSLSHGGNLLMVLVRKDTMVSP